MGIRLLQRTTRKLGLTDSGRIYYDYCARVIAEAKQANASMRHLQAAPRGVLRVSLPETFGRFFVLPLMPEFLESYPEIQLKLSFSNRKVDLIEENYDLAIRKGEIEDESLIRIMMGHSQQHIYASPDYITQHGLPEKPSDLESHNWLTATDEVGNLAVPLYKEGVVETVTLKPRLAMRDHEAIYRMVKMGAGIALVPGFLCNDDLRDGGLVRVMPEWVGTSVVFNAVYPSYKGLAPNTCAFLDFIKEKLVRQRPWENTDLRNEFPKHKIAKLVQGQSMVG
ncbi:MAG: hypothetical protein JKY34_08535 [Kordiimonadaceae bacterium]|nr:hypothetical protein [Kordiimonadaceae bacterium]